MSGLSSGLIPIGGGGKEGKKEKSKQKPQSFLKTFDMDQDDLSDDEDDILKIIAKSDTKGKKSNDQSTRFRRNLGPNASSVSRNKPVFDGGTFTSSEDEESPSGVRDNSTKNAYNFTSYDDDFSQEEDSDIGKDPDESEESGGYIPTSLSNQQTVNKPVSLPGGINSLDDLLNDDFEAMKTSTNTGLHVESPKDETAPIQDGNINPSMGRETDKRKPLLTTDKSKQSGLGSPNDDSDGNFSLDPDELLRMTDPDYQSPLSNSMKNDRQSDEIDRQKKYCL